MDKTANSSIDSNLYQTIMVSSAMAKLYSSIMEQKINSWAEHHHKQALSQASFRLKYSTIDHLVTLRVIMGEVDFKGKHYIVVLWTSRILLTL